MNHQPESDAAIWERRCREAQKKYQDAREVVCTVDHILGRMKEMGAVEMKHQRDELHNYVKDFLDVHQI